MKSFSFVGSKSQRNKNLKCIDLHIICYLYANMGNSPFKLNCRSTKAFSGYSNFLGRACIPVSHLNVKCSHNIGFIETKMRQNDKTIFSLSTLTKVQRRWPRSGSVLTPWWSTPTALPPSATTVGRCCGVSFDRDSNVTVNLRPLLCTVVANPIEHNLRSAPLSYPSPPSPPCQVAG